MQREKVSGPAFVGTIVGVAALVCLLVSTKEKNYREARAAPLVNVNKLPEVRPPCELQQLSAGDIFRLYPDGTLFLKCEIAAAPEPGYVLHGVEGQQRRREWERERVTLAADGLDRFAIGLLGSAACTSTLDRPEPIYAVDLSRRPGELTAMTPDQWVYPVHKATLTVSEP